MVRADANCLRFGARVGTNCVLSCWGMMLVPALVPHSVPAMICAQAISTYERYELRRWISPVAWQLGALRTIGGREASAFELFPVLHRPQRVGGHGRRVVVEALSRGVAVVEHVPAA